jgi:hypothetical protein
MDTQPHHRRLRRRGARVLGCRQPTLSIRKRQLAAYTSGPPTERDHRKRDRAHGGEVGGVAVSARVHQPSRASLTASGARTTPVRMRSRRRGAGRHRASVANDAREGAGAALRRPTVQRVSFSRRAATSRRSVFRSRRSLSCRLRSCRFARRCGRWRRRRTTRRRSRRVPRRPSGRRVCHRRRCRAGVPRR